jgi:dipeptidyl aminopeptidase/acylaminoacyl peptidase
MTHSRRFFAVALVAAFVAPLATLAPLTAEEARYRLPPKAILDVLRAPQLPTAFVSPSHDAILLATPLRYPPVADLARPMLRIAGLRIDPKTNGIHHASSYDAYALVRIADGKRIAVALPAGVHASAPVWSPDGSSFAFGNATSHGVDLYLGVTATGAIRRLNAIELNTIFNGGIQWMPDGKTLLVYFVPASRGAAPVAPAVPLGPVVQQSNGKKAPAVTFEDLLANPTDEALFDHYASGRYAFVDVATARVAALTPLGVYSRARVAPNAREVLLDRIHRPYSYAVPYEAFPHELTVVDQTGKLLRRVVDVPLQENATFDTVDTGPRDVAWRADKAATLVWTEAQDNGDPATPAAIRDIVYQADATQPGAKRAIVSLAGRFRGLDFVEGTSLALVRDYDREKRVTRTLEVDLDTANATPFELNRLRDGDQYHNPGQPVARSARTGEAVVVRDGDAIFLRGAGAGPDGRRPFLDRLDLRTHQTTRLFQSELAPLEAVFALLDARGTALLLQRQSPSEPPNYVVRKAGSTAERALTAFADPTPLLRQIQRRVVTYKRPDGVELSFTLYLPPGYKEGTRLPTLLWAYPFEFNDPSIAGQNTNSTQTFTTISGPSQIFAALAGYAVLDNASVPIVGDPKTVNDTFLDQLIADAKAAIDKAAALGVTDPGKVAVGGHSYGAFMTANLLAHTRLFRAGIARSGAYNRSLTPFGFQSERRTYWEATDLYTKMSPFTYADKIADPILLTHGMADDNTGTFPIQSERLFAAIRGNGGTARLVMLPYEAHGYVGRESIETVLAEMLDWLDKYVKNAPPRS